MDGLYVEIYLINEVVFSFVGQLYKHFGKIAKSL